MARVPRQPGSSFKPLVYAAAFERGLTPDTIVLDTPLTIGTDTPKNYEGGYRGPMKIRQALAWSRNIPAIRTFQDIGGEDTVLDLAERVGMTTPTEYKKEQLLKDPHFTYGWPMAIGSTEVPLLEMINLYATIADHGIYKPLKVLCAVTDRQNRRILPVSPQKPVQAMVDFAANEVDSILRDSDSRPEGFWRDILTIPGLDTGAKTGTSNVFFVRDEFGRCMEYGVNNVWTMGYSPDLVVGVWVGNADNTALSPLADGLTVAAPIWRQFVEQSSRIYHAEEEGCY
jgi:membrane peptidoglycan carboxypeptidase